MDFKKYKKLFNEPAMISGWVYMAWLTILFVYLCLGFEPIVLNLLSVSTVFGTMLSLFIYKIVISEEDRNGPRWFE